MAEKVCHSVRREMHNETISLLSFSWHVILLHFPAVHFWLKVDRTVFILLKYHFILYWDWYCKYTTLRNKIISTETGYKACSWILSILTNARSGKVRMKAWNMLSGLRHTLLHSVTQHLRESRIQMSIPLPGVHVGCSRRLLTSVEFPRAISSLVVRPLPKAARMNSRNIF